ncbi:hypothetical protein ACRE1S_01555 [Helicobacter himalayensis]
MAKALKAEFAKCENSGLNLESSKFKSLESLKDSKLLGDFLL